MSIPKGTKEYGLPTVEENQKLTRTKSLFIILVLIIISSSSVTQWIAHKLNYHSALGGFNGFYAPWEWYFWSSNIGAKHSKLFETAKSFGTLVFVILFCFYTTIIMLGKQKQKGHKYLHGSARWATIKEIKKMGVLENTGVYIGGYYDKAKKKLLYLVHNGAEHVLAFAPTRSGKGVGLVIPTLLGWSESALVLDIKGENYALTAGWRRKFLGQKCIRFDPSALVGSARFNPVEEVRFGTDYEVGDAQNLAMMIVDPKGRGLESHWDKQAFSLVTGIILYSLVISSEENTISNLPHIANILSNPEIPELELWEKMLACDHSIVSSVGRDMTDKGDDERTSVVSTAKGHLSLYKDPIVARNISSSDFKISDLMNFETPISLYLVAKPADKSRMLPILRIFISQTVNLLCPELEFENGQPKPTYKHKLLMLLDEFPALGKIEVLESALGFIAGYGIKAYLIAQDLEQLVKAYGNDENITSNVHIQACYAPNKPKTADYISKKCGTTTVVKKSISVSGSRLGLFLKNTNQNLQEVKRELLTPDEVQRLPAAEKSGNKIIKPGDMLVFVAGSPPIYGKQILYFLDPIFSKRVKIDAGSTDTIYSTSGEDDSGRSITNAPLTKLEDFL